MILERFLRRRRAEPVPALVDDGTLVVVGSCFDPARADSAVVAEMRAAGVAVETGPFVMRHLVTLPDHDAVAEATRILAADGWAVTVVAADERPLRVRIARQQVLTGLEPARERTRMAGLAQRLGGDAEGYEVLARG
ncbi:ribonuclease E inhibitor RraB [Embleya scabrispora]|uniref:Regulator of ribonuclease activity B domain-containing protein n=1 Tax=Embleya scabrispora TaxID=159449 RepID=A0A1T3P2L2_9ACTN|nr:ribonuclease E inhibitor RraB [Embleya scabrispora]OPC83244.1 hypothetical protein B4N89_21930 [Embleya scabrispora]